MVIQQSLPAAAGVASINCQSSSGIAQLTLVAPGIRKGKQCAEFQDHMAVQIWPTDVAATAHSGAMDLSNSSSAHSDACYHANPESSIINLVDAHAGTDATAPAAALQPAMISNSCNTATTYMEQAAAARMAPAECAQCVTKLPACVDVSAAAADPGRIRQQQHLQAPHPAAVRAVKAAALPADDANACDLKLTTDELLPDSPTAVAAPAGLTADCTDVVAAFQSIPQPLAAVPAAAVPAAAVPAEADLPPSPLAPADLAPLAPPDPSEGPVVAAEYSRYLERHAAGVTLRQRWHRLAETGRLTAIRTDWEEWWGDVPLRALQGLHAGRGGGGGARGRRRRDERDGGCDPDDLAPRQARSRRAPQALQDFQVEPPAASVSPAPPAADGYTAGGGAAGGGAAGGGGGEHWGSYSNMPAAAATATVDEDSCAAAKDDDDRDQQGRAGHAALAARKLSCRGRGGRGCRGGGRRGATARRVVHRVVHSQRQQQQQQWHQGASAARQQSWSQWEPGQHWQQQQQHFELQHYLHQQQEQQYHYQQQQPQEEVAGAAAGGAEAGGPISGALVREIYKMGAQLGAAMQQQQGGPGSRGATSTAAHPAGLTAALEAMCLHLFQGDVSAMMQHMTAAIGQEQLSRQQE